MTVTYVGNLSIGAAIPGAAAGLVAGVAGIGGALPDIQARLAALLAFVPTPVDFTAQLVLAQSIVTSVTAAISLGLPVPDISAQLAIVAAQIAALLAAVTAVNAQLTIITDLQAIFATAGLHVYAYTGATNAAGGEITTALAGGLPGSGPGVLANGLLLATTSGATWSACTQVFQVSP